MDRQITLAGQYTISDFQVSVLLFSNALSTTTSVANGTLTFVSAGYSTVTGGGEAMTVFGGSGGDTIFATAAVGSATVSGGSTFLALQDGVPITLARVTNLIATPFV